MKALKNTLIVTSILIITGFIFVNSQAEKANYYDCGGSFAVYVNGTCPNYTITVYQNGTSFGSCSGGCTHCCLNVPKAGYYDLYANNGNCAGWSNHQYWDGYQDTRVDINVNCYSPNH